MIIKLLKKTILITLFATTPLASTAVSAEEINLFYTLKKALELSDESKLAQSTLRSTGYDISAAFSAYLPRLTLSGSANNNSQELNSTRVITNSLSLRQVLLDGGNRSARTDVAKISFEIAKIEYAKTINKIIITVTRLYYQIIKQRKLIKEYKLAEDQARTNLEKEKIRFEAGVVDKTPFLRAESQLYNFIAQRSSSEANLNGLIGEYIRIVGAAPPDNLPLPKIAEIPVISNLEQGQIDALKKNLDLLIANYRVQIAEQNVEIAYSANYPSLDLTGRVSSNATTNLETDQSTDAKTSSIGIEYSIPLYAGGANSASIDKSLSAQKIAKIALNISLSSTRVGVVSAWQEYLSAKSTLVASQRVSEANKLVHRANQIRHDAGQIELETLLDSQTSKLNSISNEYDSHQRYAIAVLNLLETTGSLYETLIKLAAPTSAVANTQTPPKKLKK